MKTTPLIKTMAAATLLLAAVCWSAHAEDATVLWNKNCASCHGKDGKGQTMMGKKNGAKDYTDAKVQADLTDEAALKAIKEGVKVDGKEVMKSFAEKVSDDDAKALVAYLRTFKK